MRILKNQKYSVNTAEIILKKCHVTHGLEGRVRY